MQEPLQLAVGPGVNLPHDLVPDDTKVLYDLCGHPIQEIDFDDPDDELVADGREHNRYANLAMAYYNNKHCTEYKVDISYGNRWCHEIMWYYEKGIVHCGFSAAQTTVDGCDSSVKSLKSFFSVLEQSTQNTDDVLVVSCCIIDGFESVSCEGCAVIMCSERDPNWYEKEVERCLRSYKEGLSLEKKYDSYLANGVMLSEKARMRLLYPSLAVTYYNKKHHTNYKLVDALPYFYATGPEIVIHCNFIARQDDAPPNDVSNMLFFAELQTCVGGPLRGVTACRILHGCKTMAGCHICGGRQGKRVIHPIRGFRHGCYPFVYRSLRKRRR